MQNSFFPGLIWGIVFLLFCTVFAGCTTVSPQDNLTAAEIRTAFLASSDKIIDYSSEYSAKTTGLVRFDYKKPGLYRMEYVISENPVSGTIEVMNRTMAVAYNPSEKTYRIEPDMQDLPLHDYQKIVQQIVRDGHFSVTGRSTLDGHAIYQIDGLPDNWQPKDMPYLMSGIRAWIDPASGLAKNITTYYPTGTANNQITYSRLDVNTGIPDDYFAFIPPDCVVVECGYNSGISDRENFNSENLPVALEPGCMNCTGALLTRPVGGFSGNRLLVSLYNYTASGREPDPDPQRSINYTFYARAMNPGKVRYTLSRVAGLYGTDPLPMPGNITVGIELDEYFAEPDHEYTSTVTAHVKPATVLRENFWIHIHADVEGVSDAITDDWVRLAIDDGSPMSGMGLYHFYQGGGGYCQKVLVIPQGGSMQIPFAVRTGELDTGNVTLALIPSPCIVDHGPLRPDERPAWPAGIRAAITPDRFTGRSFASYLPELSFTVDPSVTPGDYCFSAVLRTPTGGSEYAPFTVRVIAGES